LEFYICKLWSFGYGRQVTESKMITESKERILMWRLRWFSSFHIKILSLDFVTILLSVTCLPYPKLQSLCFDCKFTYIKLQSYPLIILLILYNCYRILGWFYIASFILSSSYALFYLHFIINCASDHLVSEP
jgi:hypothetical protein